MTNKQDLNNLKDDEIYFYLICSKTLKNFNLYSEDDLFKRLKEIYKDEKEIIEDDYNVLFDFVKDKYRYELLNNLLKQVVEYLKKDKFPGYKDNFLVDHLNYLLDFITDYCIKKSQFIKQKSLNIPSLDGNLREEFIRELLKGLDPSLELLNKYNWAKDSKRIINLDEYSIEESKIILAKYGLSKPIDCCLFLDDGPLIILSNKGNIEDLVNFAHEFAHFINGKRLSPTLCEYYSIFFELYTMKFLLNKNFTKKEITYLYSYRVNDIIKSFFDGSIPFYYLKLYLQNEEVNEKDDINFYKNIENARKLAHRSCDKCIEQLMRKPYIISETYSYLIGFVLADITLNNLQKEPNLLNEIISFGKNCNDNPQDIIELIDFQIDNLKRKKVKR